MLAMHYVPPSRVSDAEFADSAAELVVGDVNAKGQRRERAALLASERASDESTARPGQWLKDCELCPALVMIAPGSFTMGGANAPEEQPSHRVSLNGFFLGRFEVTQAEWIAIMGSNPSASKTCGAECPVDRINWHDAQAFVKKLSERTGKHYRLPTEAEWEYAARAGSRSAWSFGNDAGKLGQYAWFNDNSKGGVHPVGLKQANPFGLHDMHGNVWEWVEDAFLEDYNRASADGKPPQEAGNKDLRVLRGGSWYNNAKDLSVSKRNPNAPDEGYVFFGLRVARSL
jgi:formylglycine-generating enzyme required for sulfatase activity